MSDHKEKKRIAVVLFNLGGPDKIESVRPFLFNLFNDKHIITIPQPFRFLLAWLISKKRNSEAQEIYEKMGGKSPLLDYTNEQSSELQNLLNDTQNEISYKTFIAMRYWHPMTNIVAQDVKDWRPDHIILLPLYPQFSTSTTLSSYKEWKKLSSKLNLDVSTRLSCCYPVQNDFIQSHADITLKNLKSFQNKTDSKVRILFSAHGLPQKFIDKGDPYRSQIEATVEAVVQKMKEIDPTVDFEHMVTFQSRVGPLKWTSPYTDEEIKKAGHESVALLISPIAFVSEHSETLVELGQEYRELAEHSGVPAYDVVPALGTDQSYIKSLFSEVQRLSHPGSEISSFTGKRFCSKNWKQCPCQLY